MIFLWQYTVSFFSFDQQQESYPRPLPSTTLVEAINSVVTALAILLRLPYRVSHRKNIHSKNLSIINSCKLKFNLLTNPTYCTFRPWLP